MPADLGSIFEVLFHLPQALWAAFVEVSDTNELGKLGHLDVHSFVEDNSSRTWCGFDLYGIAASRGFALHLPLFFDPVKNLRKRHVPKVEWLRTTILRSFHN